MQTNNAIVPIIENAPPPLAPLTHVVISPDNIAAEARRQRAIRLTRRQRRAFQREIKRLDRQLEKANYPGLIAALDALRPQMEFLSERHKDAVEKYREDPLDLEGQAELKAVREEIRPKLRRWRLLRARAKQIAPLAEKRAQLAARLEDHQISLKREKEEHRLMKLMVKEARIYEQLIIDKWTRLGFCYRYTASDKQRVDKVKFSEVGITTDAIFFKIDASYQTAFKNWKTNLPQGVRISDQLLDPVTLTELSIACQRQVTGLYNSNGAWVVVHRLDSLDGLMNYVNYQSVMEFFPYQHIDRMPICVGVGLNRKINWTNLADFPHWLIGGYTNSGKSNMVNVGICTLISTQSPQDLRLILIDLKGGLEFHYYQGIPHLHRIVDNIEGVADSLAELEAIMQFRFGKFKGIAKRIEEYHAKRPAEHMPRILCVFDEVASIMDHGETTKRILASLRELTRMGRAVGIHIWLCTQRPDVKAIEGSIKANLAVRISGRMTTSADSVTVLGHSMAKDLAAVQGRMILQLGPDPVAIQTPHIKDDDIMAALQKAMTYPPPPSIEMPFVKRVVHQQWTPERVVELSLKHLGGNITWKAVYEAADDLSQSQARQLVERIWNMECIPFEGKEYRVVRGRGHARTLAEIT